MPLVPSYIENLENYVPGKPIEEVQRELGLDHIDKLASNENPIGPSPKAVNEINNRKKNKKSEERNKPKLDIMKNKNDIPPNTLRLIEESEKNIKN